MHSALRPFILLTLLLPACAFADTINFNLYGVLQDGGTATGVLAVDTLSGYVNPTKVTVSDGGRTYIFIGSFYEGVYAGATPLEFYSTSYNQEDDNLLLSFPTLLKGYEGGSLCSTTVVCQGFTSSFNPFISSPSIAIDFTSLTATAVPEPASLTLLAIGLAAVTAAYRHRTRGVCHAPIPM